MTPDKPDYEDASKALKIFGDATDHVDKLMNEHANFMVRTSMFNQ